jgi:hypothetical protein
MRRFAAFPVLLAAAGALPCAAAEPGACTSSNATGGDIRVVTCTLAGPGAWRFLANFGGGHDDTSASLTVTLDGRPAACDAGSKTSLFGEDGDVGLACRIAAAPDAAAPRTLVVTVLWSHAQYRDFRLVAD